ncbi:MAG: hypothetical protein OXC19_17595 [Bryobacterales bacterium]|nr:hypothetical protein [Bryobacterales bacterium]
MRCLAIFLATFVQVAVLPGAGTRSWELSRYGDFLAGTFQNVALDREGSLRVAPSLDTVHDSEQAVLWSIARAADGTVYFGTGHQGAVFKVSPDGQGEQLWKAPEIEVFALAAGPDGFLYVGTSPEGKVYKVSSDGESEVFFDPGEKYIWSLLFDSKGHLIVGTGDGGKVYRVGTDGKGAAWFESGQRHVMSLALDSSGHVLAGTDPEGILYRVAEDGTAFGLFDSDLPEIRSVAVTGDGSIYFAAMGGGMDRLLQAIPAGQAVMSVQAAGGAATSTAATTRVGSTVSYAQPQVTYAGERAALMRLRDGQAVEKLWSSNEENILGLVVRDGTDPGALFATDQEGRIYATGKDRQLSLISQTGRAQMTVLSQSGDGILVGSAHGGALYRLGEAAADSGHYDSVPFDTSGVSRWGRLSWRGDALEGAAIEIQTRSGNTYRPDTTWSGWSDPLDAMAGSPVPSPPARFLQWRVTLKGTARLDSLRVHYLPQNSAPVVKSVNVVPETVKASDSSSSQSSSTSNSYSITVSASGSSSAPRQTGQQSTATTSLRKLAIVWSAEDPDGDKLRAEVSFRGEGETNWKTIRDDVSGSRLSIESDTLADGHYEFRVKVDDGQANSPERALEAERISRPVLVDQTPPRVRQLPDGSGGELRFEVEDEVSEIRSAEFSVDAGDWGPVLSDDGILDSRQETFTLPLEDLEPGEHLVVLRVRDRVGNAALAKSLRP